VATVVDGPSEVLPAPDRRRPRSRPALLAGLCGLVAVVCAILLPFAPVAVNVPTVSWPRDGMPESTLLPLTAYRPLALDVRFGCATAAAAPADSGGLVVATMRPTAPEAARSGLLVTASGGRVVVRASGRVLLDEPLPAGTCTYRVVGGSAGLPSYLEDPPTPTGRFDPGVPVTRPEPDLGRFAGPDNAELVVFRDGRELVRASAEQLPDVDALVTSLAPGPRADLAVQLRLDDEFASSPTPRKTVLVVVLGAALAATAGLLLLAWPVRWRCRRPAATTALTGAAVAAVLVAWLFVAPATDDDGWFATQARNAAVSDGIGSYYQLYDHGFVPFTWAYEALSRWQQLAGTQPAVQRIPALVLGLLTWVLVQRVVAAAAMSWAPDARWLRAGVPVVSAVAFLAWWLPYDMGVRPEVVVAFCGVATLAAVLAAGSGGGPAAAWLACALAGAGVTAHTSGVTALAPLVAGFPLLRRAVAVPGDRRATALRGVAAGSGLALGALLGFADGALRDFLRSRTVIASVLSQEGWPDEIERYAFLLDQIPMGNFAKRAAVLACLVALGWTAVLAATAAARRVPLPAALWLPTASTALSFAALALTPSKWTHHFGALAGVGAAFLASALLLAVPISRRLGRPPWWLVAAVAGSFALALALTWRGPNSWPYAWLAGVRTPYAPPAVDGATAENPLLWLLAVVVVAGVLAVVRGLDRRWAGLAGVAVVVAGSLAASSAYAVGTFATAAAQGLPRDSIWARTAADPTGCGAADAIRVLNPFEAQPLALAGLPDAPPPDGFVAGGGHVVDNRPQGAAAAQVWGSLVSRDGRSADDTTGRMSTGWYALPAGGDTAVTVIVAGSLGQGNVLTATYARDVDGSAADVGTQPLVDEARSPSWRTFVLAPLPGADLVRLDAVDTSASTHGWLAFSAPVASSAVALRDLVPQQAPIALGWQLAFAYPCQRPPAVADGISEPPRFAVLRSTVPLGGLTDLAFQPGRGGVFGHVPRSQSVLQLATVGPVDPYVQVYAFDTELARDAYTLTTTSRVVAGASTATG